MKSVLFVCLGNICRSPMAEGVFGAVAEARGLDLMIDSAGTGSWHVGEPPDDRAQSAAAARGVDISAQRARRVARRDFEVFDLIVAMDRSNVSALESLAPPHERARIRLFLDFAAGAPAAEVPDPYYGGDDGFEAVLDVIEAGSRALLARLT